MPEIGGLQYLPIFNQLWDTAMEAYRMEQKILTFFNDYRNASNHEIIQRVSRKELEDIWIKYSTRQNI